LLECESAESWERKGNTLQSTPVTLLATVCKWQVKRSFESSTRPRKRMAKAQGCTGFEQGLGGGDGAWKIKWFQFCGYLIRVST
jgi:hypothetical protein